MLARVAAAIDRSPWVLALALILTAAQLVFASREIEIVEDAFITLRAAMNVHDGYGAVFSAGEAHWEASTSFLWMALNAAAMGIGDDPRASARLMGLTLTLGALLLTALAARRSGIVPAPLVPLVAVVTPDFAQYAMNGYESPLLWFFEALALYLFARRADTERFASRGLSIAVGVAIALGAMTRPEAALFAVMPLAWLVAGDAPRGARRRAVVVAIGTALGVLAVYYAAKLAYFGELLPASFHVKTEGDLAHPAATIARGLVYLGKFFVAQPWWAVAGVALLPIGRTALPWRHRLPALIGIAAYSAFILLVGGDQPHNPGCRFFLYMLPFWLVAATQAAFLVLRTVRLTVAGSVAVVIAVAVLGSNVERAVPAAWTEHFPSAGNDLCAVGSRGQHYITLARPSLVLPGVPYEPRPAIFASIALAVRKALGERFTIVSDSAGELAYYAGTGATFIDLIGLGTPECVPLRAGAEGCAKFVASRRPEVIVLEATPDQGGLATGCWNCTELTTALPEYRPVLVVTYDEGNVVDLPDVSRAAVVFARSDVGDKFASLAGSGTPRAFRLNGRSETIAPGGVIGFRDLAALLCQPKYEPVRE
jgi:hypothetical protein